MMVGVSTRGIIWMMVENDYILNVWSMTNELSYFILQPHTVVCNSFSSSRVNDVYLSIYKYTIRII